MALKDELEQNVSRRSGETAQKIFTPPRATSLAGAISPSFYPPGGGGAGAAQPVSYDPNKEGLMRTGIAGSALAKSGWLGTRPGDVSGLAPTPAISKITPPAITPRMDDELVHEAATPPVLPVATPAPIPDASGILRSPIPGGGERVTMEGVEGGITLPSDWKAPTSEEAIGIIGPRIAEQEAGRRSAAEAALGPRRSLAEKEREEGGGLTPREFDYGEFQKVIKQLGGDNVPIPLRTRIYETILKDVEGHNQRIEDYKKARMSLGPQQLQAETAARAQQVNERISMAKTGPEIAKIISEVAENEAQISGAKSREEVDKAQIRLITSQIQKPEYQHLKDKIDVYLKIAQDTMTSPEDRAQYYQEIKTIFSEGAVSSDAYRAKVAFLKKSNPNLQFPSEPPPFGTVLTVAPGKKAKWDGRKFVTVTE